MPDWHAEQDDDAPSDPVADLRAAARRAAARTGLELVEAAKLSECHEALKAVVEG